MRMRTRKRTRMQLLFCRQGVDFELPAVIKQYFAGYARVQERQRIGSAGSSKPPGHTPAGGVRSVVLRHREIRGAHQVPGENDSLVQGLIGAYHPEEIVGPALRA